MGHRWVAKTFCNWQPRVSATDGFGVTVNGMRILQNFPSGLIIPAAFKVGHLEEYNSCVAKLNQNKFWGNAAENSKRVME
jgi:hypothetical protein